jgi:hypothetical protein
MNAKLKNNEGLRIGRILIGAVACWAMWVVAFVLWVAVETIINPSFAVPTPLAFRLLFFWFPLGSLFWSPVARFFNFVVGRFLV